MQLDTGQSDPFGNGIKPGHASTGYVYEPVGDLPEPAFYQMAIFLSLGSLGVFRLLRKARCEVNAL